MNDALVHFCLIMNSSHEFSTELFSLSSGSANHVWSTAHVQAMNSVGLSTPNTLEKLAFLVVVKTDLVVQHTGYVDLEATIANLTKLNTMK